MAYIFFHVGFYDSVKHLQLLFALKAWCTTQLIYDFQDTTIGILFTSVQLTTKPEVVLTVTVTTLDFTTLLFT